MRKEREILKETKGRTQRERKGERDKVSRMDQAGDWMREKKEEMRERDKTKKDEERRGERKRKGGYTELRRWSD